MLISATKGIEDVSFPALTEVIRASLVEQGHADVDSIAIGALMAVLRSGSSRRNADRGDRCFDEPSDAALIQKQFSNETLRLYTNDDLIGVEMGGALKNVIAIAPAWWPARVSGSTPPRTHHPGHRRNDPLAVAAGGQRETLPA